MVYHESLFSLLYSCTNSIWGHSKMTPPGVGGRKGGVYQKLYKKWHLGEGVTQYSDLTHSLFYTDGGFISYFLIISPPVPVLTFSCFNEYQKFAIDVALSSCFISFDKISSILLQNTSQYFCRNNICISRLRISIVPVHASVFLHKISQ